MRLLSAKKLKGFTLVEALVALGILAIVGVGTLQVFGKLSAVVRVSGEKIDGTALANEQIEIIRNLPFTDVGIVSGIPSGKIPRDQTLTRDNHRFLVTTTIRNVDDPFDGTIGGTPNDLSPADYKLVEVRVSCQDCQHPGTPLVTTTTVAPKNLETASTNGALFIRVFDASGVPIQNASVHVENHQHNPAIIIDELTNINGELQIVDAPPGVNAYEITVTKDGYSTDQTLLPGAPGNPNPSTPHVTVILQEVTQVSFSIDRLSTIHVSTTTDTCAPVGDVDFHLTGAKLIGTSPDVPKYSADHLTNGTGELSLPDMEWDTYALTMTDATQELQGTIPLLPLSVAPNATQDLHLTVKPKNPQSLLIAVKDSATLLPVSDATVKLEKTGFAQTLTTGRGFLKQTDWSGGSGQEIFTDASRYASDDGSVDVTTIPGQITLKNVFGAFAASGELLSSTFDTGTSSNFYNLTWQPQSQAPETGADSVRFQIATNSDQTTWDFLGPDGTNTTYYTVSETNINALHNGDRYLRYKLFLQTADTTISPVISDVAFTFTSSCVPSGQALFDGLTNGTYTATIEKTGYQTVVENLDITDAWKQYDITFLPE